MAVKSISVTEAFLEELIQKIPFIQIYGGRDFKYNFYPPSKEVKEILELIENSLEETIQLNITISDPWDEYKEASSSLMNMVKKLIKIANSQGIEIVNPMRSLHASCWDFSKTSIN